MSVLPPPVRARPTDTEPSPAPAVIITVGLVLGLSRGLVKLGGPARPDWVREIDHQIPQDAMLPLFIGLFAAGTVAQGWRLAWLCGHGRASVSYRRVLDWALVILGVVALTPALDPNPGKWVDPWFYVVVLCGGLMVAVSVTCLRRRA